MKKILWLMLAFAVPAALSAKRVAKGGGLNYEITKQGSGKVAQPGMRVQVHYTGWLNQGGKKGKKFDSSVDRGRPFVFGLGGGQVIRGWDEGVAGMKVGEKRTLFIPSAMGYGPRGAGAAIPPNADLIFDVELLDCE
ncbi:MAG: FKBP-type peptidyl-prolyl cis-trans isomerase [Spirochaetes bacterium]|nr:FKBP-type peptidyl-prolyl cis-trans isomerase [Spirochaetota bacterium]